MGRRCPYLLQFAFLHEHASSGGLSVVLIEHKAVFLKRIVHHHHISNRLVFGQFSVRVVGNELLRRDLIEVGGIDLFDHHCLPIDVGGVNRTVVHEDVYLFTNDLSVLAPNNGVAIERKDIVLRREDKRVSHRLHVLAISAGVKVAVHDAID